MKTVILAGGLGTRLWPYTASFPKPLVPLGNVPVVEVLIRDLQRQGFKDITLTLGHLAELVQAYFHHRKHRFGDLRLQFVVEEEPTGTAGFLSLVSGLDETFLVTNGDLLTDLDFQELVEFHRQQGAMLTIATHQRQEKVDLGVLRFDEHSRITSYKEKPVHDYHVSMGVYVYEPAVLRFIEPGCFLNFPDLVNRLLGLGERVCAFPTKCLWLDIGRPDDYAKAQQVFADNEKHEPSVVSHPAK